MSFLQSNIPYFKCWVRREYTCNHEDYHGEFLSAMAVAVTTIPNRCLSFQVIFTGYEADEGEQNVHGGAMWAWMPLTALVGDTPFEEWPKPMDVYQAQPWDCMSRTHAVYSIQRAQPCPWLAKVKKVNKPFARKIQILTVGEQRAKVMGKQKVAQIFRQGKDSIRKGKKDGTERRSKKVASKKSGSGTKKG